jgi:hypothetical protein
MVNQAAMLATQEEEIGRMEIKFCGQPLQKVRKTISTNSWVQGSTHKRITVQMGPGIK